MPAGKIVGSRPAAGARLIGGATVELQISTGPAASSVPELVGKSLSAAKALLHAAGLAVGRVTYSYDDKKRGDVVLRQRPAAGGEAAKDSPVDLVVNEGD